VDNPVKCIIDGLQEAGVIKNDKLIEDLHVTLDRKKTGRLIVDIEYIENIA
jgi:Holliday junction resolvase RusA-like endonuclease